MIRNVELLNNKVTVTYELSDDELNMLRYLNEHKYMEFRRGKDTSVADELYDNGFVESDLDSWHYTVVLTELGKSVASNI